MNQTAPAVGISWLLIRPMLLAVAFLVAQLAYAYWPTAEGRGVPRLDAEVRREYAMMDIYAGTTLRETVLYIRHRLLAGMPQRPPGAAAQGAGRAAHEWYAMTHILSARIALRLGVLAAVSPLYLLLSMVVVVDGLVARHIRRAACGRESSFIYHRVKATLLFLAGAVLLWYLCTPWAMDPLRLLVAYCVPHALLLHQWAAAFKKYL